jgi:protein-L-isoaspartate(D-aspartate) O-methyltransferase
MNDPCEAARAAMVTTQIEQRGLTDPRLLAAFRAVPRHRFVPAELTAKAYDDKPLPIGWGQTISQPYIVALMTDLLQLQGDETVLEIGAGSGYQAAILAELARSVHTIELEPSLAQAARALLPALGYTNVAVHVSDGCLGWPEQAPYQAILVTAAAPAPPPLLLNQLAPAGRLVLPVGGPGEQILQVWQRSPSGFYSENILTVSFVPMRGSCGWDEIAWPNQVER